MHTPRHTNRIRTAVGYVRTAVGYVRVSTQEQASEGVSLDVQRDRIRGYCKAQGLKVIDIKGDEGASGATLDRPGLQAALSLLRRHRADTLIVMKLDRLSRSLRDVCSLVEELFSDAQFHLLSLCGMVNTHSAAGRMVLLNLACDPFPRNGPTDQGEEPRQRKEVNEPILDNWNFVRVKFPPPRCKGEALPPSGRLTINRMRRGRRVVTRSLTGNPIEHS